MKSAENIKRIFLFLVVLLFVNLPLASAIQITNVRAVDITHNSALITWNTDEPADSFVGYGESKENLQRRGDAQPVVEHQIQLTDLESNSRYFYSVESGNFIDDNLGDYYSFTTPEPDTTPPTLAVEIPSAAGGASLSISGKSEAQAQITIFVSGQQAAVTVADAEGAFSFIDVPLIPNQANTIRIQAADRFGNSAVVEGTVFSDTSPPRLNIKDLPEIVTEATVELSGTVSEESSVEIILGGTSIKTLQAVTSFAEMIRLNEGDNFVVVVARDRAGLEARQEFTVIADTKPPQVHFELAKGMEYYEGRAETDITGETEANADVFLYIFRAETREFKPTFDRALAKTTADAEGKFTFTDVEFPPPPFTSLEQLAPQQTATTLEDIVISPISDNAQKKIYHVFIIAEDKAGKMASARKVVNVNTCFTANFGFDVSLVPEFPPQPFRLDPQLIEEGREEISAVFNITYRGNAVALPPLGTSGIRAEDNKPYRLVNAVKFEKACTRETAGTDDYSLGCRLISGVNSQANFDKTTYYMTAKLLPAADFLETEDDVWDDFVSKRQLKFPLKILVNYQERTPEGGWSETKSQVYCSDLGYFVDRPIESEDLVPDFLADEGVDALNATINAIEQVKPYLETATIATGVSCIGSFLTKMTVRFYRFFMTNFEPWLRRAAIVGEDACPQNQNGLYLEETIEHWKDVNGKGLGNAPVLTEKESLDKKCPQTAKAWELEEFFDKIYKGTCDRFFCRAVPAGWTEYKEKADVDNVIIQQQQCSATTQCSPLIKIEDCRERVQRGITTSELITAENRPFPCWQTADGALYIRCEIGSTDPLCRDAEDLARQDTVRLRRVHEIGVSAEPTLLAYQPGDSDSLCVAVDKECANVCDQKKDYVPAGDSIPGQAKGCYEEIVDPVTGKTKLVGANGQSITGTKLQAGYTKDCFINKQNPAQRYQCVCELDPEKQNENKNLGIARAAQLRTDLPEPVKEEWQYREARLYEETNKRAGTYYPEWRYYSGRDFTAAFGQDWLLDNFKPDTATDFAETKVNPHTQHFGAFQSMCLPGIRARLLQLQSILQGARDCIITAKHTGEFDAGQCKTIFTQYVCGMIYKGIAYLGNQCSPLSIKDVGVDYTDSDIAKAFESGFKAIPQAMDTSIQEIKSDYGNAQLENFFATGTQGFAESICLAAFGYDFPMGMDFIQDAAYSFPTKTSALIFPAERELKTFDPVKGTAVHSYTVGASIVPGCKIRGYRTELKCVGLDDMPHPGIDCSSQECDCLRIQNRRPELEAERSYLLQGGSGFRELTQNQLFEIPIESPQKVSSNYRYDHVVLRLALDPNEDPEQCFDEGYRTANGGVFYYPITDISPPAALQCQVDPNSGRFICPKIASLFQGGQTYFEFPYVECYDRETEDFVDCRNRNLFVFNRQDDIVVKPYIHVGSDDICLRIKDSLTGDEILTQPLPAGFVGPYAPRIPLGKVTQNMVTGGSAATLRLDPAQSDVGCGGNNGDVQVLEFPTSSPTERKTITFVYISLGEGKYKVTIDQQVQLSPTRNSYTFGNDRILMLDGRSVLTPTEIDAAEFILDGIRFTKIFGSPQPSKKQCAYQLVPPRGGGVASRAGAYRVNLELVQAAEGSGSCFNARDPLPDTPLGRTVTTADLTVQTDLVEVVAAEGIHQDFLAANYDRVEQKARAIVERDEQTLPDALARYYWVASLVARAEKLRVDVEPKIKAYTSEIYSLIQKFFEKSYPDVENTAEFQKVKAYLCEIDYQLERRYQSNQCNGYVTYCGNDKVTLKSDFAPPEGWKDYRCRVGESGERCYGANDYVPPGGSTTILGCPGTAGTATNQLCCPSKNE